MGAGQAAVRGVVFDFDYTLADSSSGIVACVEDALARLAMRAPGPQAIRSTIGLTLEEMFAALAPGVGPDRAVEFRRHFLARADRTMVEATVLYADAAPTLRELRRRGIAVAVCTTKYRRRVEGVLRRERLEGLVDAIVGSDEVDRPKPDPEPALLALGRIGVPASEALFVGDSEVDGETARRAGTRFAAVTRGPTPVERLRRWDPVTVTEGVGGVIRWLDEVNGGSGSVEGRRGGGPG